jgi:hypothetical protein
VPCACASLRICCSRRASSCSRTGMGEAVCVFRVRV